MTWYFLAYIISKLSRYTGQLDFDICEIEDVLKKLWTQHSVSIVDNREMLLDELRLLERLGLVRVIGDKVVIDFEKLRQLENTIMSDPLVSKDTYFAYLKERIDKALEQMFKT